MPSRSEFIRSLTDENTAWLVWKSYRKLPASRVNIVLAAWVALGVQLVLVWKGLEGVELVRLMATISDKGLTLGVIVFGVLVAGFSIFGTFSSTQLVRGLAVTEYKETGLSCLKALMLSFLGPLLEFWTLSFVCGVSYLAAQPLVAGMTGTWGSSPYLLDPVIKLVIAIVCGLMMYGILVVRTFSYNVYAAVMQALRFELQEEFKEERDRE